MAIVITAVLILCAGVFLAAMVESGRQDDSWPEEMDNGVTND